MDDPSPGNFSRKSVKELFAEGEMLVSNPDDQLVEGAFSKLLFDGTDATQNADFRSGRRADPIIEKHHLAVMTIGKRVVGDLPAQIPRPGNGKGPAQARLTVSFTENRGRCLVSR